jgi:hypothetical protein
MAVGLGFQVQVAQAAQSLAGGPQNTQVELVAILEEWRVAVLLVGAAQAGTLEMAEMGATQLALVAAGAVALVD